MKKISIHLLASIFIIGMFFVPTVSSLAKCPEDPGCPSTNNPPSGNTGTPPSGSINTGGQDQTINTKIINPFRTGGSITDLFLAILNGIVLPIGGILAVLAFIYSGFKFVMAQGSESEIKDARRNLLYVAIGTVILLGASAIAGAIETTLKQFQ